jgi:phosphopantetheinyl transferase
MPIVHTIDIESGFRLALWELNEKQQELYKRIRLSSLEVKEYHKIKNEKRKLEWLGARHALHHLYESKERNTLIKDIHGKPYFEQKEEHLSLSHSSDMAVAMISDRLCGVDIQKMDPRIYKICQRILSDSEMKEIHSSDKDLLYPTLYWCAKEAIFKAYGKGKVDLQNDISVSGFELESGFYISQGIIRNEMAFIHLDLIAFEWKEYVILAANKKEV